MQDSEEGGNGGRVVAGLVIVVVGVAMLMDRTGIADMSLHLSGRYWPVILIVLGLARLFDPPRRHGRPSYRSGGWLLWIGLWGLVSEFHAFGLDYDTSWPLLVIGAGLAMMWRALGGPEQPDGQPVQGS
jgi:hypothetical protein